MVSWAYKPSQIKMCNPLLDYVTQPFASVIPFLQALYAYVISCSLVRGARLEYVQGLISQHLSPNITCLWQKIYNPY